MTVLELGHWSWERRDADGVARAILGHASCVSVRIVPPGESCPGWSVAATYEDPPAPRQVALRAGAPAPGGRR
jgi:hypothetical protein